MFGRYVLVEAIGDGAAQAQWLAIDVDLDRKVALELSPVFAPEHSAGQRDEPGARSTGRSPQRTSRTRQASLSSFATLAHPNIAAIHDRGERDGQQFVAREYVEGEGLDRWLARGPYPWQEALPVLRQIGAGLRAVHEAGLVHGSLRPSRVILGRDGRVRVLDASRPRPAAFHYLAPEQLRDDRADARSDVFTLSLLAFEALHGVRPYDAAGPEALRETIERGQMLELPADERAPAWIFSVLVRGLAAQPDARFESIDALLAPLAHSPRQRRKRRLARASLVVLALAGVGALLLALSGRGDPCAPPSERLSSTWTEARSEALARRVAAHASDDAATAVVLEGIEAHVAAWRAVEVQLCREQHSKRSTARLERQRDACLERRRVALAALAELSDDDAEPELLAALARRPRRALRSLGKPARCLEIRLDAAQTELELPALELGLGLARARLILALEPPDSGALALRVLEPHAALEHAELELLRALAEVRAGHGERAREQLEHSAQRSIVGHPQLAAQAWLGLLELELAALATAEPSAREQQARRIDHLLDYGDALAPHEALDLRAGLAHARAAQALELADPARAREASSHIERLRGELDSAPDLSATLDDARGSLSGLLTARETPR